MDRMMNDTPKSAEAIRQYWEGMKALEAELVTLCQNGGQSWAWVKEAASRLRRAYDDKLEGKGE